MMMQEKKDRKWGYLKLYDNIKATTLPLNPMSSSVIPAVIIIILK